MSTCQELHQRSGSVGIAMDGGNVSGSIALSDVERGKIDRDSSIEPCVDDENELRKGSIERKLQFKPRQVWMMPFGFQPQYDAC